MALCEKLEKCPFFTGRMDAMPAVTNMLKARYCQGDKMECARYQVATAGLEVPNDLFPHDIERAKEIIGKS